MYLFAHTEPEWAKYLSNRVLPLYGIPMGIHQF